MTDASFPSFPEPLVRRIADGAMAYPYRLWGFGEDIALRGLLDASDHLDDPSYREFVFDLVQGWCRDRGQLRPQDHVAPGWVLLDAHRATGDELLLATALELGELLAAMPRAGGVILHRPDLEPWSDAIWVDCMYMDAPFLLRLWRVTGLKRWLDLAVEHATAYTRVLQDPATGLFWHGYRAGQRTPVGQLWGRGNGWALLGLLETLAELPDTHPSFHSLQEATVRLIHALLPLQHPSGAWRTILDDPDAPLENSTAPLFASGLMVALELGLHADAVNAAMGADARSFTQANAATAIRKALGHLRQALGTTGELPISTATPIGDRATYTDRSQGVFPWGQGPALIAIAAARHHGSTLQRSRSSDATRRS